MPFIALYLADIFSPLFSGVFLTISTVLNVIASFLGGYISDNKNKSSIMVYSQLLLALFMVIMAVSLLNDQYIILFCIFYLLFNFTYGAQFPILEATLMNAIVDNDHDVYKIQYWFNNIATAAGALIGGFFYHWKPYILFIIGFSIFLLIAILYKKWIIASDIQTENKKMNTRNIVKTYISIFKDKPYIFLLLGYSFILIGEFSLSSYVSVKLKEQFHNITIFNINIDGVLMFSILMFTNTVIVVILTGIISKISKKTSPSKQLLIGFIMYTIGYFIVSYSNFFSILLIAMILATIGEIIYAPIYNVLKFRLIPQKNRGSYLAISSLGFHFSQIVSRLLLVLYVYISVTNMSIILGCILILGSMLVIGVNKIKNIVEN